VPRGRGRGRGHAHPQLTRGSGGASLAPLVESEVDPGQNWILKDLNVKEAIW